jgi:retron-type reverse transcriptase/5-methylcytosine-specific restriction endonuclease McrA
MVEWKDTNWRKLERVVFKLQKRIYRATQRGDVKAVRKLQKTLMRSWSAKCLAVRKVTQDNQGKKTAGIDGVKSLTPLQRLELVSKLSLNQKAKPTRRVWIPKPGSEEKRPLGIPTMYDRALQALVKQTIEPEWEARFEPNSFGFRPGRSCHDAIEAIFTVIAQKSRYVLDADISKCFDCINHEALLEKLNTFPTIRRQIRAWLKAGVIDKGVFDDTSEGTLISRLNPIIRGWANYYSTVVSKEVLSGMDKLIYQQLRAWSNFRHPNKDSYWIARRYWLIDQGEGWVFASRKENKKLRLIKHAETPITRHIKVRGESSPYDGDWIYWSTRMGMHPEAAARVSKLLKKQKGKCTHCELYFKNGDLLEIDHKKPRSKGGKNTQDNLQLLHRHCHDSKTANDNKAARGTNDNSQIIEEPCEVKVSRTVL